MPTSFFIHDVGNREIKLGMQSTTVLSEQGRHIGTHCTHGLPHFLESLICKNIWKEKKG